MIHDLLADAPAPEYIKVLAEILRTDKLRNNEYVKTKINPVINEFSVIAIYNYLANMNVLRDYIVDEVVDFMNVSFSYVAVAKIITKKAKDYEYGYFVVHPYDTFDVYIIKTSNTDILWVPLTTVTYIPESIPKLYNNTIKLVYSLEDRSGAFYIFFPFYEGENVNNAKINEVAEKMTLRSWKKGFVEVEMPNVKGQYKIEVYLREHGDYVEVAVPSESVKKWIEYAIENYYHRASVIV